VSALRLAPGVYCDPHTRARVEPCVQVSLPAWTPPPVIRRRLSPDELAAVRARDGLPVGLPIRGMLTNAELARRKAARLPQHGADASRRKAQERIPDAVVREAVARLGSVQAASVELGLPYSTCYRRNRG